MEYESLPPSANATRLAEEITSFMTSFALEALENSPESDPRQLQMDFYSVLAAELYAVVAMYWRSGIEFEQIDRLISNAVLNCRRIIEENPDIV